MISDFGKSRVLERVSKIQLASGEVMDHAVNWDPSKWKIPSLKSIRPHVEKFSDGHRLGDGMMSISRRDVIEKSESSQEVFVGAMLFGHGPIGYGPTRVARVIGENDDLSELIQRQYSAALDGPAQSWLSHTKKDKIQHLGPAFATKFAYFSSRKERSDGLIPLIADANTSWAMWWFAGVPRSVELLDSYLRYVDIAHQWGNEVGGRYGVDEVERAIFTEGKLVPHRLPA